MKKQNKTKGCGIQGEEREKKNKKKLVGDVATGIKHLQVLPIMEERV
jgi:hypothetical protein